MDTGSLLEKPLVGLTRSIVLGRRHVVVAALVLAVLASGVTVRWLGFRTSRLDLLNPRSDFNRRWLAYLDEFGDRDDVLVVVAAQSPEPIAATVEELGAAIERETDWYDGVLYRTDLSQLRSKGLHHVPLADLRRLQGGLKSLEPLLIGDWQRWQQSFLPNAAMLAGPERVWDGVSPSGSERPPPAKGAEIAGGPHDPASGGLASLWREHLQCALAGEDAPLPGMDQWEQFSARWAEFDTRPLLADDQRLGFIALQFKPRGDALVRGGEQVTRLRRILAQVGARHPLVEIGLTGMPVLEYDEMCSSQTDMTVATVVSLVGVILLLLAGLGSWRYAILSVVVLLIGMAWSFGFVTLAIGHLNILSISFAAILIGLGIDFGIHYLVRYVQIRSGGAPLGAALINTAREIGPGVVTGAVTTAFAFFAAGLTDFTGVVELGVIAGAGILICLGAALVVTPALTYVCDRRWPVRRVAQPLALGPILLPLQVAPGSMAILMVLVAAGALFGVARLRYDHNLLNLQPRRLDSVLWEHRLLNHSDRSVFYAVSVCQDRHELQRRKRAFDLLPSVERTEEIVSLVPESTATQREIIAAIHQQLGQLPSHVPALPPIPPEQASALLERLLPGVRGDDAHAEELSGTAAARQASLEQQLAQLTPAECVARLTAYQQRLTERLLEHLLLLRSVADPQPATWSDVPRELTQRFVGRTGKQLLRVYAQGNVWDMPELERFVSQLETVDGQVTGHPVQTYYASRQMQRSYIHAAVYALLALLIVLMLDFRNLSHSLLAVLPLVMGVWLMFGVLGWLDIPLNPANMIVLPLILGIGIDSGVHVVHDWRNQGAKGYSLSPSVAVAMLLCSSTTMVGFSSMVFARHQGLRTLGEVLTLGLACCQASSLFFLPGLLMWLGRRHPANRSALAERGHPFHAGEPQRASPP